MTGYCEPALRATRLPALIERSVSWSLPELTALSKASQELSFFVCVKRMRERLSLTLVKSVLNQAI